MFEFKSWSDRVEFITWIDTFECITVFTYLIISIFSIILFIKSVVDVESDIISFIYSLILNELSHVKL